MNRDETETMLREIAAHIERRINEKTAKLEQQVQTLVEKVATLDVKAMALEAQIEERRLHVVEGRKSA